jgi:hypothetical protein
MKVCSRNSKGGFYSTLKKANRKRHLQQQKVFSTQTLTFIDAFYSKQDIWSFDSASIILFNLLKHLLCITVVFVISYSAFLRILSPPRVSIHN